MQAALKSALEERRPFKLRALDGPVKFPNPYLLPLNLYEAVDHSKAPANDARALPDRHARTSARARCVERRRFDGGSPPSRNARCHRDP
jgi:hypothetical protein